MAATAVPPIMGTFMASPLVVRREKRSRRNRKPPLSSRSREEKRVKKSFVFEEPTDEESRYFTYESKSNHLSSDDTFSFRPKHDSKDKSKDHGLTASRRKKDRTLKQQERQERLQLKKEEMEAEEKYAASIRDQLSGEQMKVFECLRDHVRWELKKARKDSGKSTARNDMFELSM